MNTNTSIPIYEDDDIARALNWFLSFMSAKHWETRRASIEKSVKIEIGRTEPKDASLSDMKPLSVRDDRIGWYLYLVDCLLNDMPSYELIQGARVVPLFKRIGMDLDFLKSVEGIELKVKRLLKQEKSQADAILFEMLTALMWVKNGWNVSFIPTTSGKSPDLLAKKCGEEFYIECKRLAQSSTYAIHERDKWLKMLTFIKDDLMPRNLLLDVIFHVELHTLDDTFLREQLSGKLPLIVKPGCIISNETWTVNVSFVDIDAINRHLDRYFVKYASTQLRYLIGGERAEEIGFSSGMKAKYFPIGEGSGNNLYISGIAKAFGVYWQCDAPISIDTKARDIWCQLRDAIEQFPEQKNAVVHIGLETLDGIKVAKERLSKIEKTVSFWDSGNKNVDWVYCHFFQSYTPIKEVWVFDETVRWFAKDMWNVINDPLEQGCFLIIPWDVPDDDNVHWNKPQP